MKNKENKSQVNIEALREKVLKEQDKYIDRFSAALTKEIEKNFQVDGLIKEACKCYRIHPNKNFNGTYIFYLYGSNMCQHITEEQWKFIFNISKKMGVGLFVPMYPLAPDYSCRDTFNKLEKLYAELTRGYDIKKLILMGDGSGAGLALSLAMLAWKEGYRKPNQLILCSPLLDTEFFDKVLEKQVIEAGIGKKKHFFNEDAKEFINTYWVKDYAVKTEYTSPFYEDYTDICDDIVVFSGVNDIFNCYARAFYQKAKLQGVNIRFFEFEDADYDLMINADNRASKEAFGYLYDVIMESYRHSLAELYPIKLIANWTKNYPDVIKDEWASRFIYENKIDFNAIDVHLSEYRNLMLASSYGACDAKVKNFILKFPNATIINLKCGLDNMFKRLDNGRIQWYSVDTHNIMSIRRAVYGENDREKTVGRTIMDFSWLDEINCRRNQGVMFVCKDALCYMRKNQVKELIARIYSKFPGAELVFTASTSGATNYTNLMFNNMAIYSNKKRCSINDAQKLLGEWETDYHVVAEEPVTKYAGKQKKLKLGTRIAMIYNKISYNHKIIHVKLGSEAYEIMV